jgi:hypothetical protein
MADADAQTRAAAYIDREFEEQQRALVLEHQRQERRELSFRRNELMAYARQREEGEQRHWQAIRAQEDREHRAQADLEKQQRGIRGRLTGLFRPGLHQQQRDALTQKFEAERLTMHRQHEARKERLFEDEQKTRLKHAREMKEFRQQHADDRGHHAERHREGRAQKVETRTQDARQAAEQELRRALQELDRQQGRTRQQTEDRTLKGAFSGGRSR